MAVQQPPPVLLAAEDERDPQRPILLRQVADLATLALDRNQHGEVVIEYDRTNLVRRRSS